jgi:ATP-dependent Lon protease
MRDFRDAKTMAQTLRDNLNAKAVTISHSESLELVSKMLGIADWNTLSAMLRTDRDDDRSVSTRQPTGSTTYPAIPLRDFVPFPGMTVPFFVGREKTMQALDHAFERQRAIVLAVQKESGIDAPGPNDVHEVGLLASPLEVVRLPDTTMRVLTQVDRRVAIRHFTGESGAYQADVGEISEEPVADASVLIQMAVKRFDSYATKRDLRLRPATRSAIDQTRDPGRIADIISPYLVLPLRDKQILLETIDPVARLQRVDALINGASAPPPSAELAQTLSRAVTDAGQRRHAHATLEHMLLALTDDKDAAGVMQGCGVDLAVLRDDLTRYVDATFEKQAAGPTGAKPSAAFLRVSESAAMEAWEEGRKAVTGADVLIHLFAEWKSPAVQQLVRQRMTQKDALNFIEKDVAKRR